MRMATAGPLLLLALFLAPAAGALAQPAGAPAAPFGPIDPDLSAELPPLVAPDLERPALDLDAPAAPQEPSPRAAGAPAVTGLDPELSRPLTPLQDFEVVTRQPGAAVAEETPAAVRYSVQTAGLPTKALESRFRELSALHENRAAPSPLSQIAARTAADAELIQRLLRAEGWYDGRVDPVTAPVGDEPDRVRVTLNVTPGDRYRIGEIVVTSPPTQPPDLARAALPLQPADPLVAEDVLAAEANVRLRLPQQGYPFAEVGPRDVLLKPATATADYTLPVSPGPRSSFGRIRMTGDPVFGSGHAETIARFEPGELYDERKVDDLRRALVATSLFSSVGVTPTRTGLERSDGTQAVDLVVVANAAPPRTLAGAIGYGAGEGARVEANWTHRNLFPPEGALSLGAVAGTKEQRLRAEFRRSNAGKRDRTLLLLAEASRERREESFDATALTVRARLSRDSTPIWRKTWTYGVGAELTASAERARRDVPLRTYYIAAAPGELGYDRSDDLLDPTRGFRIAARLSPELSFSDGASPYVRGFLGASAYQPVSDALVLAVRGSLGSIVGAPRSAIAPSRRLYGGGGGSVRGYGYRQLGPVAANGERVGGRSLVEASLEARYRLGAFGIVPFVDVGQAYEGPTPSFADLRFGAGLGARYYTNFGPIRVDVARGLTRRAGDPKFAVYISIGQAF